MTQHYGIIAHPVSHSLSPPLQMAGFSHYNIDADFVRYDIPPEKLEECITTTVRTLPLHGSAVSLPHKEKIIPYLDQITETAKQIGAVNTLFWKDGQLWGENTDAIGFWNAIKNNLSDTQNKRALIIGAGGASRAILSALKQQGISCTLCNRTMAKASLLAEEFGIEAQVLSDIMLKNFDIVVNATSVGLQEDKSPVSKDIWKGFSGLAFDAVFTPLITRFLEDAKGAGADIVTGERMLLEQGIRQFEIWTQHTAPRAVMSTALKMSL